MAAAREQREQNLPPLPVLRAPTLEGAIDAVGRTVKSVGVGVSLKEAIRYALRFPEVRAAMKGRKLLLKVRHGGRDSFLDIDS